MSKLPYDVVIIYHSRNIVRFMFSSNNITLALFLLTTLYFVELQVKIAAVTVSTYDII